MARAKDEGKYKGRVPTAQRKADVVARMAAAGTGAVEIARSLGIGRASVYRILAVQGVTAAAAS